MKNAALCSFDKQRRLIILCLAGLVNLSFLVGKGLLDLTDSHLMGVSFKVPNQNPG